MWVHVEASLVTEGCLAMSLQSMSLVRCLATLGHVLFVLGYLISPRSCSIFYAQWVYRQANELQHSSFPGSKLVRKAGLMLFGRVN